MAGGRGLHPTPDFDTLIVANGGGIRAGRVRRLHRGAALTIATDGAASRLLAMGIMPDLVVGDFDSMAPTVEAKLPAGVAVHVPDQDRCDLDKAIALAIERGARSITIAGGLGRRWDHSLTTISLLVRYASDARIRVVRGRTTIMAVTDHAAIAGCDGDRLSLVAFAPAHGVTLTGVQWPLNDATVEPGSLGVSNRMTGARAELRLRSGCLIVCHHRARSAGGADR